MSKVYERVTWVNSPSTSTPLNETNLNKMDKALDDIDTKVSELEAAKVTVTSVDENTVRITF